MLDDASIDGLFTFPVAGDDDPFASLILATQQAPPLRRNR
jgi:hypothetical protein